MIQWHWLRNDNNLYKDHTWISETQDFAFPITSISL